MNNFCTLFDSHYLTRGLCLYHSLQKHAEAFTLHVYCFDDTAYEIISALTLPNLIPVALSEFESPKLLAVKSERSRGEYCWTCTSHVIRDAIVRFALPEVTYLDADLYFFAAPEILMREFVASGGAVLLTEHRYTPRYDQSSASGRYCVQFMTFTADDPGMAALDWWCDRTLEWCYNRHEDGKFGDQKYLDDWLTRFAGVHVLQHPGGGVAPWNIQQYKTATGPTVNGSPVVFYHFHNLAWYEDDSFMLGRYRISSSAVNHIYRPYIDELKKQLHTVQQLYPGFSNGKVPCPDKKRSFWRSLEHKLKGKFHVIR